MKKIILAILLLSLINCKGQVKRTDTSNNKNSNTMEYFDIKKYENLEKDDFKESRINDKFYKLGNIKFRVLFQETIKVEETNINTNFQINKTYYLTSKQIKSVCNFFLNFPVGISQEYDETGKLVKEINYDLPYNFSIEDLQKKMKGIYDIDILNPKEIRTIHRYIENTKLKLPLYEITSFDKTNANKQNCYIINATNGETIYIGKRESEGKQGSVLDQYFNSLKK